MNNRILKSSNNGKRTLQIIRNNKVGTGGGPAFAADNTKENNFQFFDSSREVAANIMLSQKESPPPPQQKKISFSESRESFSYEVDTTGPAVKKSVVKIRRSSSSFKMGSSGRINSMEELMAAYVEMLRGRGVLHLQHSNYVVESNKFGRILAFIINAYNGSENILQFHQKLVRADAKFNDFMRKSEYGKGLPCERLKFKKLLALSPKVYEYTIFNQEHAHLREQYKKLECESALLREQVKALRTRREEVQAEVVKRNNDFTIINFQIEKLQYDFDQYIKREQYLKGIINTRQEILADLDQRRYNIVSVYEEPQMAAHRQSFEEAKRLEESLFLFAEFLKCHPLGDRVYEHSKRAVCNERLLEKELREMKRMLVSSLPQAEKENLVSVFFGKYHQQYREIMEELQAVIAEKTALIHRFTAVMQDWRGKHLKKHVILTALKDAFLLEEIQCERLHGGPREDGKAVRIIENVIKLFKVCHPLF